MEPAPPPPYTPNPEVYNRIEKDTFIAYCERIWKYRHQGKSALGGMSILMNTGIFFGWAFIRINDNEFWSNAIHENLILLTVAAIFVAAVLGSIIGAILVQNVQKKIIYCVGILLMVISNTILIIWGDVWYPVLCSRCIAGLTHGIVYITCLIHIGENSHKDVRGMTTGNLNLSVFLGIMLGAFIYGLNTESDFSLELIIGIIGVVFSLFSVLMTFARYHESNVFLVQHGQDQVCQFNIAKMSNDSTISEAVLSHYNDIKRMTQEDALENENLLADNNWRPILTCILLTSSQVLSHSCITYFVLIEMCSFVYDEPKVVIAMYILAPRLFSNGLAVLLVDILGRKKLMFLSGILCSLLMFLLGFAYLSENIPNVLVIVFSVAYQLTAGFGVHPVADLTATEAFGLAKKRWSIGIVHCWQFVLQAVFVVVQFHVTWVDSALYSYVFLNAFFTLGLTACCFSQMPELKRTSLREARDLFRKERPLLQCGEKVLVDDPDHRSNLKFYSEG